MSKVTVIPNGPILIEGEHQVLQNGQKITDDTQRPVTALCACGRSQNKPYCDGKHKDIDFRKTNNT